MNIAIVGSTGTVGAATARELTGRGHAVKGLSRHPPEYPVELRDGSGLTRALAGVDVVVDACQGGRDVLVEGTRRLLAAELAAGVGHHIGVSADAAEAEPSYSITQFAGPEVLDAGELARLWRESTGSRAVAVRLPAPRSVRAGGLTNPAVWRGTITFDRWLAS